MVVRRVGRALLALLVVVATLASIAAPPPASAQALNPAFLQALGKDLYWNNQKVILKGTNFDNINALGANIGSNNVNNILLTNADYALVASHGANHVRLGLSFSWYQNQQADFWTRMDQQVGYARANGIFLVFNMFTTPGNCYEGYGNHCPFWGQVGEQNALRAFWVAMATRYKNEPAVAGYDILNEPTPQAGCQVWFPIANTIYQAIRQVNTNQLVFIETCSDPGNDLKYNGPPRGPGIVYEVHDYFPMDHSHDMFTPGSTYPGSAKEWFGTCVVDKDEMAGITNNCSGYGNVRENYGINWATTNNVPIYIGEWGSTSRLNGYAQYHKDKAELYRDWGVNHAHYTWAHGTIALGDFYQWGIVQRGSQVIDDLPKLNAVKISWAGAVRPNFTTGAFSTSTAIATQTPTQTFTPAPTRTNTPTPNATLGTPTATNTPAPPTNTPSLTPTNTTAPTQTNTPVPPASVSSTQFYRGINLGGPAVSIDGNLWQAGANASNLTINGYNLDNPYMTLSPAASGDKATMLRAYRQHWSFNASLASVADGTYTVYLYVVQDWNDPSPATVTFTVEGVTAGSYTPGGAGTWEKLGPYNVTMSDGTLNITANDLVNLAGIEIFQSVTATATPTNTATPTATSTNTPGPTAVPGGTASFTLRVSVLPDGRRQIDITTTTTGGITIVMDDWAPDNTPIANSVGGCWQVLGSFVCNGSLVGDISLTVPSNVTYVHAMQRGGQGVRVWRQ